VILVVVAVLAFALDRLSKHFIVASFLPNESRIAIPHFLWWTYVQNHAGAFGLFGTSPILLIVLALAVLALFAWAFKDAVKTSLVVQVAFGAIVGGAAGNILDRVQQQYVVDFIDFKTIWPNVFNVGDSCITIGVAILILSSLRREKTS
jgi:lipoprotein signal peptidase